MEMKGSPSFGPWRALATRPWLWRLALRGLRMFGWKPAVALGPPALRRWARNHKIPEKDGEPFREWWEKREIN
jgi:hypothetical protein